MSFQRDYELWEERIKSVQNNELIKLRESVDVFAAKCETLAVEANKDRESLKNVGLDLTLLDELPSLTGALRYCQAIWMGEFRTKKEAQEKWNAANPLGYELKSELLHFFTFAYRKRPNITKALQPMRKSSGHIDMIQDLLELGTLGKKYPEPLITIGFDLSKLDVAKDTSHSLRDLLAIANGDKGSENMTKLLRDKTYTLLLNKVREVREYGRFIFWRNDKRRAKYIDS